MKKLKSLIGITMGDAAGIGPEIICKMFLRKSYKKFCEILLIGDEDIFNRTIHHYKYSIRVRAVDQTEDVLLLKNNELGLIQIKDRINGNGFQPGRPNKAFGAAALKSVDTAVDLARHGKIDGIVTAPVNKEVVALTYKKFIGHTEYIAEKLKTDNFNMMMASSKMKVTLVTTHTAIKDVAKNITKKKVIQA
ncbi:MAG: 4-hydroxythreonine-4-phosphate dehydrogenase PdxA, partial [Spirochaetes bacterium]|nr:4-hydroxythreonine-4-phosphate dehydrogenase PdxA [Spirochaetota bacterium]